MARKMVGAATSGTLDFANKAYVDAQANGALAPISATLYWQLIPYSGNTAAVTTGGSEFAIQMPIQAQTFDAMSVWVSTAAAGEKILIGFRKLGSNGTPGSLEGSVIFPADSTGRSTVTGLSVVLSGGLYAVCFAATGTAAYRGGPHAGSWLSVAFGSYGGGLHTIGALETNRTTAIENGNAPSTSGFASSWSLASGTSSTVPPIIAVRRSA